MENLKVLRNKRGAVESSDDREFDADDSSHTLEAGKGPGSVGHSTTVYDHFEILRRPDGSLWSLGAGAMGQTFKALDTRLQCTVVLKVLRPGLLGRSATTLERFLREARTAASVDHPNVARV